MLLFRVKKIISCAAITRLMEMPKTSVPMALTCGSMVPCTISNTCTGIVLFKPETNHDTVNSSNDTAAVKNNEDRIAGRQYGRITLRIARHSDAPRFHAAASRLSSIWFNLSLIIAMAKGAVSTVCAPR